jgi:transcriptional regulator with XRE-family HTH domain
MKLSDRIRILMIKCGNLKEAELARKMGVSPQNLNNKLKKGYFTIDDLQKVADAMDCDLTVEFVIRETGEKV